MVEDCWQIEACAGFRPVPHLTVHHTWKVQLGRQGGTPWWRVRGRVGAATTRVGAATKRVGAATKRVGAATKRHKRCGWQVDQPGGSYHPACGARRGAGDGRACFQSTTSTASTACCLAKQAGRPAVPRQCPCMHVPLAARALRVKHVQ